MNAVCGHCLIGRCAEECPPEAGVPYWAPFVGEWHLRPWPCPTAVAAGAEALTPGA